MQIKTRQIMACDWPLIMKIQAEAYVDIQPESEEVLHSKAEFSPETCLVAESQGTQIAGYCLAHPWERCGYPHLHEICRPSVNCDNIFIHDMSVASKFRSRKVAHTLFKSLYTVCRNKNYRTMTLVSVQNSRSFWEKLGFSEDPAVDVSCKYGKDAILMCRYTTTI